MLWTSRATRATLRATQRIGTPNRLGAPSRRTWATSRQLKTGRAPRTNVGISIGRGYSAFIHVGQGMVRGLSTTQGGGLPPPPPPSSPQQPESASSANVVEVTRENFQSIVQGSQTVPTIIDCYADWCGPCKTLTPMLESVVNAAGGKLVLAKINTDHNPDLAQALKVSSLPTVYGLFGGKMVDSFVGVPDKARLQGFLDGLLAHAGVQPGSDQQTGPAAGTADAEYEAGQIALEEGDLEYAAGKFKAVLSHEDTDDKDEIAARAMGGLLRSAQLADDSAAVESLLSGPLSSDNMESPHYRHLQLPEIAKAVADAKLFLRSQPTAEGQVNIADLEATLQENPKHIDTWYALALARLAEGDRAKAIDASLRVVRLDKAWNNAAGKTLALEIIESAEDAAFKKDSRLRLTNLLLV